ncbi:unnamed protein product [Adineta ricciae]|uniref:Uncharacterized protein n=1 Tax=Adineta ricciae TaxID=249248 RepID=A0A815V426_ADIRI|nr:unnamed protein product [Adineta ricciae]
MLVFINQLYQKLKVPLKNYNLFSSIPPTTDEYQLQNQRISTRVFIVILVSSLLILVLYTSLIDITQTVTINQPTLTKYLELSSLHSQTLTCDCQQISINYQTFLQIKYTFHQICNSIFITQNWFDFLSGGRPNEIVLVEDFRRTSTFIFQSLNTLCNLVKQTINNRLIQFYSTQYVSSSVVPSETFSLQVDSFISQFISSMTNDFLLSLSSIRQMIQSNALLSALLTNYNLYEYSSILFVYSSARWFGNCSCATSAKCIYQAAIYNSTGSLLFIVPGMYSGCYIVESLLQSDLRCFYNQSCLSQIQSYFYESTLMNIRALNESLLMEFHVDSTIEVILNNLMIEKWDWLITYENYYNECAASQCSYTYETKNRPIYIVTTIIGLAGGLITVLRLFVPRLINNIRRKKQMTRDEIGKIHTRF